MNPAGAAGFEASLGPEDGAAMRVTQIALGRFHHFHLARQLEARGLLQEIWSGYPRSKLRDEVGIAPARIRSYPWFYVPSVGMGRVPGFGRWRALRRELHWRAVEAIDAHVAGRIRDPGVLVGLSSGGLKSGRRMQEVGGRYVCDRGSTHIRFQNDILAEEYARWDLRFHPIDPRIVDKEEAEYEAADLITVPSRFCQSSFRLRGTPAAKVRVIPYGGRLDRFRTMGAPDPERFNVLFVGAVSVRKGAPYLLQAFARLRHHRKRLKIIGFMDDDMRALLRRLPSDGVEFLGGAPNAELARHYSEADALVLPSIEEGLALVLAEAMACGCPVIATPNTGAEDLVAHEEGGLIVPARSSEAIVEALERLADDRVFAGRMRLAARRRIEALGGYDAYGAQWASLLAGLQVEASPGPRSGQPSAWRPSCMTPP